MERNLELSRDELGRSRASEVSRMERRTVYRALLVLVLILTAIYTLGLLGVVSFRVSYYITIFMIFLFIILRMDHHRGKEDD